MHSMLSRKEAVVDFAFITHQGVPRPLMLLSSHAGGADGGAKGGAQFSAHILVHFLNSFLHAFFLSEHAARSSLHLFLHESSQSWHSDVDVDATAACTVRGGGSGGGDGGGGECGMQRMGQLAALHAWISWSLPGCWLWQSAWHCHTSSALPQSGDGKDGGGGDGGGRSGCGDGGGAAQNPQLALQRSKN